jgi:hypothetical protein
MKPIDSVIPETTVQVFEKAKALCKAGDDMVKLIPLNSELEARFVSVMSEVIGEAIRHSFE